MVQALANVGLRCTLLKLAAPNPFMAREIQAIELTRFTVMAQNFGKCKKMRFRPSYLRQLALLTLPLSVSLRSFGQS